MKYKCKRKTCGHEWDARVKNPKQCPKCKSYNWNKEERRPINFSQ